MLVSALKPRLVRIGSDVGSASTKTWRQPRPDASAAYDRLYREVYVHLFPAVRDAMDRLTALTAADAQDGV